MYVLEQFKFLRMYVVLRYFYIQNQNSLFRRVDYHKTKADIKLVAKDHSLLTLFDCHPNPYAQIVNERE